MNESQHNILKHCTERLAILGKAKLVFGFKVSSELEPSYIDLDSEVVRNLDVPANQMLSIKSWIISNFVDKACLKQELFIESSNRAVAEAYQLPEEIENVRYIPICDDTSIFGVIFLINQPSSYLSKGLFDATPFIAASISLFRSRRQTANIPKPVARGTQNQNSTLVDTLFKHTYHPVIIFNDLFKVIKANQASHSLFKQNIERGWKSADILIKKHFPLIAEEIFNSIGRFTFLKHLDRSEWRDTPFWMNNYHSVQVDVCLFEVHVGGFSCFGLMLNEKTQASIDSNEDSSSIQRFNALTSMLPIAILQVDANRHCTYANDCWTHFTQLDQQESKNTGWMKCFPQGTLDILFSQIVKQMNTADKYLTELCLTTKKGKELWVNVSAVGLFCDKYQFRGAIITLHDVTESKNFANKLEQLATTDQLTGLSNRAFFHDRLELAIERSARHGTIALLFIDLDKFKHINDTYGHAAGDFIIVTVAGRLKTALRKEDSIARLGGDEFAIILTEITNNYVLSTIATKLVESIAVPVQWEDRALYLSCSIGIAVTGNADIDRKELLRRADLALYKAKDSGRNQHRFYDIELERNVQLLNCIKQDLLDKRGGYFRLVCQPQINTTTNTLLGFELLTRWDHPDFTYVTPTEFIDKIENNGLLNSFTQWLFSEVSVLIKSWERLGINLEEIKIAINLSAKQLQSTNLSEIVIDTFISLGLNPKHYQIEVTETAFIAEPEQAGINLEKLRNVGFTIALDDFGTGYSSLSILRNLPLDCIKIDGSFVRGVLTEDSDMKIVKTIISLSTMLGLKLIAECVETKEISDWLKDNNCAVQQGYYFYKPLNQDDAITLLLETQNLSGNVISILS